MSISFPGGKVDAGRLIERRRISVKDWLLSNNIQTEIEFRQYLTNEGLFASEEFAKTVLGHLPQPTEVQPVQESTSPVSLVVNGDEVSVSVEVTIPETTTKRKPRKPSSSDPGDVL